MDQDEEKLGKLAIDYDLLTMHASATSIRSLKEARVEDTDLFIAVTPDESYNMTACGSAKALGAKKTRCWHRQFGVCGSAEQGTLPRNGHQQHHLSRDAGSSRHHQRSENVMGAAAMGCPRRCVGDGYHQARETCKVLDKPLHEISGPDDPFHVVAIRRRGDTIIPRGSDVLKLYDLAYFMTTRNYIPYIRRVVGKEHYVM